MSDSELSYAVVGAGAIGSVMAWRLAQGGAPVVLLGRGPHLEAIAHQGLKLTDERGSAVQRIESVTSAAGCQPCDVVVLATKAHDIAGALQAAQPLISSSTVVVPAINGLPWWYFKGQADGQERPIEAVDPGGALWRALPAQQLVGAVVHWGASLQEPGHVRQSPMPRLILGELDGRATKRTAAMARTLERGGLPTEITPSIRDAVWSKLLGNIATNPLSVVTGATLDRLFNEPQLQSIVRAQMVETLAVGAAWGARFDQDIAARIEIGRHLGPFRTSMLQDLDRGRALELGAIADAVLELADLQEIPMPVTRMVVALAREAERNNYINRSK